MGCLRGLVILVALLLIVIAAGAVINAPRPAGDPMPVARQAATLDKSDAMQADRKKLIEGLIGKGVFQKIEVPGSLPRVWVNPAFYALEFDRKQSFVSVVYAYYFDGSRDSDTVRLFDSQSGKEVGQYSMPDGGLKMF